MCEWDCNMVADLSVFISLALLPVVFTLRWIPIVWTCGVSIR